MSTLLNLCGHKPVTDTIEGDVSRIIGYCNGLVCLTDNDKGNVVLWNPSTRKSRRLPQLDTKTCPEDWINVYYGFYFDEVTDDFIVLALLGFNEYEV